MKTVYYSSYSDNFVETKNQGKTVPENYKFIKKNPLYNLAGAFLTQVLKLVGLVYGKCALGLKIEGKDKLKSYVKSEKKGYFIYANHTLTLGDVFNPGLYNPVHPYYICDSSNLGIPILGPILPMVGALPIPESIRGKKRLFNAISARARSKKAIVIYPEAHLWPYYTGIRPFESSAFSFPIRENLSIFTATTVYTKWKNHQKPRVTIYIDGPFSADENLDKKARAASLETQAHAAMERRAKLSTVKYITYEKRAS